MGNTTSISGKLLRVALSVVMAFSLSLGYSITQAGGVSGSAYAEQSDATAAATDISTIGVKDCGDQFYTGKAVTPYSGKIKTNKAGKIAEGTDFTVTYANNTEKGTATATLTGMGKYTGTVTLTFKIVDYTLTVNAADGTAIGSLTKAELAQLAADSTDNTEDVSYQYGTTVISVPAKQYVTMASLQAHFNKAGATSISTSASDGFGYTYDASIADEGYFFPAQTTSAYATDGAVQVPDVLALKWASADITSTAAAAAQSALASTDMAESVRGLMGATADDYKAGNIAGKRFVTNVTSVTTDASKQSIAYADLKDCGDQFYTGKAITPFSGSSKANNAKGRLTEGKDYTVTYANNVEKGTATATITGMGDYAGTYTKTFNIVEYTLSVTVGDEVVASLTRSDLEKLAADSTDNAVEADYQYGTTVIAVPAKKYVTLASLMTYIDRTLYNDPQITVSAPDGFGYTYNSTINDEGYFFPAQTADAYATDGAVKVPAILALNWASEEITSSAAAAAKAAAASTDMSDTVRGLMGATAADYKDGNIMGKRFVTNVNSVSVSSAAIFFSDADYTKYYGESLDFVSAFGLMTGYAGTEHPTFGVGNNMTRAEFATILWRTYCPEEAAAYDADVQAATVNKTDLADIADGAYYTAAANWAVEQGYINGIDNHDGTRSFSPAGDITMEQMVAIIGNIADASGVVPSVENANPVILNAFNDGAAVSDWAKQSMAWGISHALVHGYDDGNLLSTENISRERGATILTNAFEMGLLKVSTEEAEQE